MTAARFLKLTVIVNLVIVALSLTATHLMGFEDALPGVAWGGGLGIVNIVGLAWLGGRLVSGQGTQWIWAVALALKFSLLIGLVYVAVRYLSLDVVGFVAGLSASGLALVIATSWLAVRKGELTP